MYDRCLFIDNDKKHTDIVGTCDNIDTILIPSLNKIQRLRLESEKGLKYKSLLSYDGKAMAEVIQVINNYNKYGGEVYDEISGIQKDHVDMIRDWVFTHAGKKAILIDFDRTITVIEGLHAFGNSGFDDMKATMSSLLESYVYGDEIMDLLYDIPIEGYMNFLCGGTERINLLIQLMNFLYENHIDIFILTNNPICIHNKELFNELIMTLTGGRKVEYICAYGHKSKKNALLKENQNDERFCKQGVSGGRRGDKRKTRKKSRNIK